MTDLLTKITQGLGDGSIVEQTAPIVEEALALVANTEVSFQERLPKIFALVDKAVAADGLEKQRSGYVIEALYASANEDELDLLNDYASKA